MQTFLPYADFAASAKCLDNKRLGKQRIETWQLLDLILNQTKESRWRTHPAYEMWFLYPEALTLYGIEICKEWKRRGYKDTMLERFESVYKKQKGYFNNIQPPYWLGYDKFHISHQSNLIRKNAKHYKKQFSKVPDNLPYVWPTREKIEIDNIKVEKWKQWL